MIIMFLINQKETLEEQLLSDEKWWKTIKIDEKYNEEDVSDKPVGDTLGTIAQHIIYFGTLAEKYFFQMNLNIVFDYIFVIFWLYLNYILMTFLFWLYFDKKLYYILEPWLQNITWIEEEMIGEHFFYQFDLCKSGTWWHQLSCCCSLTVGKAAKLSVDVFLYLYEISLHQIYL